MVHCLARRGVGGYPTSTREQGHGSKGSARALNGAMADGCVADVLLVVVADTICRAGGVKMFLGAVEIVKKSTAKSRCRSTFSCLDTNRNN